MCEHIKAVNGIGPGTRPNQRDVIEKRLLAELRESNKRRADNPGPRAYNKIMGHRG